MDLPFRILLTASLSATAAAQTVFQTTFDATMPAQIAPGSALLTPVEGYAGYGPAASTFGGAFLRSETGNVVTLSLAGLPPHDRLHLDVLFAAIDSLDGAGAYPSGDYFRITLDGVTLFREAFANALPSQIQTYQPPAGVELARHVDLGFSQGFFYLDSAYYFGADPFFASIPHTASTATFTFVMEGPGIQPLADESWAFDNLRVIASFATIGTSAAYGTSCGPILTAANVPTIGQSISLQLDSLPTNTALAFCAFGLATGSYSGHVLPIPLDNWGMPGCWLLQDLRITPSLPCTVNGTSATAGIPVPNSTVWIGLQLFGQGWAIAPGVNSASIVFSNGLRIQVGQ